MTLSDKEVRYVANLANLRLSDEEVRRMSQDLGQILTHIEQLNELDTANVEPMAQVLYDADANAPASGAGYFKIPKVIER